MLKFSKKLDYALASLVYLGKFDVPKNARQVAQYLNLSQPFIANLLKELTTGGILKSVRGSGGGYFIAKDTRDTNIKQIVECIDRPLNIASCISSQDCFAYSSCPSRNTVSFLQERIISLLEEISLFDMVQASSHDNYFLTKYTHMDIKNEIFKR
ncbi:MAG: Rrf2 family transcriptional regulator [SAR324 cluster bacterium]|nr:Rrf2 family transcriptional regulator [SAR324 cluster bacterium]